MEKRVAGVEIRHLRTGRKQLLENAIADDLVSDMRGVAEAANDTAYDTARMLGRLVSILVEKGFMDEEDVSRLLNGRSIVLVKGEGE